MNAPAAQRLPCGPARARVRHPVEMAAETFEMIARLASREETTVGDMTLQLIEAGLDVFSSGGANHG